jgi:hypothetical protein
MRRLIPLVAFFLFAPLLAAPVPKAVKQKNDDYFPLALGDKWEYIRNEDPNQVWVEEVTAVEDKDDGKVATVRITPSNGRNAYDTAYLLTKDGWHFYTQSEIKYDPPSLFLKADPKAGDEWESKYTYGGATYELALSIGPAEKVTVPAGEFECLPVTTTYVAPARGRSFTNWVTPGVGLVKQVVGGRTTQELKTYTVGGKGK